MKLTKIQLKLLKQYELFAADSVTASVLIRAYWLPWLLLFVYGTLVFWITMRVGIPAVGWLVIGICAGAFFRDIGRFLMLRRTWPALRAVINWERLRELIQAHDRTS